jgi:ATP-binding cassette subfamily A (ABC1) protein 3
MVSGEMRCVGTSQQLKLKFSEGYEAQIRTISGQTDEILERFQAEFSPCRVDARHDELLQIQCLNPALDLGMFFALMERWKEEGMVQDYVLSQTSLEQVFVKLVEQAS